MRICREGAWNCRAEGALTESAKNTVYLDLSMSEVTYILTKFSARKKSVCHSKSVHSVKIISCHRSEKLKTRLRIDVHPIGASEKNPCWLQTHCFLKAVIHDIII